MKSGPIGEISPWWAIRCGEVMKAQRFAERDFRHWARPCECLSVTKASLAGVQYNITRNSKLA